jgi:hypothetical protein
MSDAMSGAMSVHVSVQDGTDDIPDSTDGTRAGAGLGPIDIPDIPRDCPARVMRMPVRPGAQQPAPAP